MRADDYEAIRKGPDVWNQYVASVRGTGLEYRPDLIGVNLSCGTLIGADLRDANLDLATLIDADLTRANLSGADLRGGHLARATMTAADLSGATLIGSNLFGSNLSGSNLSGADLSLATLTSANLIGADLSGSTLDRTVLADVDVAAFCDADVQHLGPCYIDSRTVMRSVRHPQLKEFMAACGVPRSFTEYMIDCAKAETADENGALMQSTFISYGGLDEAFARRLYGSLLARRITVFFFPETARWGERLSNEVHTQLNSHDRVILICSEHSLTRPGVLNEIQETLDREAREGGSNRLLPIALDDHLFDPNGLPSIDPGLAGRIRARIVGDFRNAQTGPAEYDKALNRLIDALKKAKP